MEGIWETQKAPVGWSLFAIPDQQNQKNRLEIEIPVVGSIILNHNLTSSVIGVKQIIAENKNKIIAGQQALALLDQVRKNPDNKDLINQLEAQSANIGYGLLLKKYTDNVALATPEMIDKAAHDTVPQVAPMYFTFRIMVFLGGSFLLIFGLAFYWSYGNKTAYENRTWFHKLVLYWIPMPWIACMCGWTVAEYGRQPWTIYGVLPTHLSASSLSRGDLIFSLSGFIFIYTVLFIIELWLMLKYAKLGPSTLQTGNYYFEKQN